MRQEICLKEGGLHVVLRVLENGDVLLLHLGRNAFDEEAIAPHTLRWYRLVEVQAAGEDQNDHHGNKHTGCNPGQALRYASHSVEQREHGSVLRLELAGKEIRVTCVMEFFHEAHVVRSHTEAVCTGGEGICLTYLSAFALTGLTKGAYDPAEGCSVSWAYNSWCSELQWRRAGLDQLGLSPVSSLDTLRRPSQYQNFSLQAASFCGRGTWPCSEYLPMGAFEDSKRGQALVWQIEAGGPWQWEISTIGGEYYLQAAGADDERHHWRRMLLPGESYRTPDVAVAFGPDREAAFAQLTCYRRRIMRPCRDNRELPVIFNDYMALLGDPTESRLLPLIDAAAEAGGEYFCVDSGWYADGNWWDSVGLWQPEHKRFPHGISYVMDYIRSKGMIPGLWLELEVMGVNCPLADQWPRECFFLRNGKRVIDHGRYQLDFRHPLVIAHANEVVDRLAGSYGVGYIKMDYNINGGYGTQWNAKSPGAGLEDHLRAYVSWLDGVQQRWPGLVIENCASGGMRMEYGLLSRLSIQSLSDQDEAVKLARIAAAAPTAVTPEQAACWSLPQAGESEEQMIFSMVNTLLLRIHQSGALNELSGEQQALLTEAIALYKTYRKELPKALPFWPLGLPSPEAPLLCLGMDLGERSLLAVWRIQNGTPVRIPLTRSFQEVRQLYPAERSTFPRLSKDGRELEAELPPAPAARLYEVRGS